MKIKATGLLNKKTEKVFGDIKSGKTAIVMTAFSILGICIGVLCETINNDVYSTVNGYYDDYLLKISEVSFFRLFLKCSAYNSILIIAAMLLGMCAVGNVLLYVIPFIKGLGIGTVCAYIYSAYAIKGVLYSAVIIFPAALIQLISIILSCCESSFMSKEILSLIEHKENENAEPNTRLYILRYCVIFGFIIFSGIVYASCVLLFSAIIN